jgi:hypothetical protein
MHSIVVTKDDNYITTEELDRWGEGIEYKYIEEKDENGEHKKIYIIDLSGESLDFGRAPFEILVTLKDKLRYVIASFCKYIYTYAEDFEYTNKVYNDNLDVVENIENTIREVYPEFDHIELPNLVESHNDWYYDCAWHMQEYADDEGDVIHPALLRFIFPSDEGVENRYKDHDDEEPVEVYCMKGDKKVLLHQTGNWSNAAYFGSVDHQSKNLLQDFLDKPGMTLKEFLFNKKYYVVIDGDEYCIFDMYKNNNIIRTDNIVEEFYGNFEEENE